MGYKDPPKEHQFKAGHVANPKGRGKNYLTADKIKVLVSKHAEMTEGQLNRLISNPESSILDKAIAQTFLNCARDGNFGQLEAMLQRTLGRVKDQLEISTPKPYVIERSEGEYVELGAKIIAESEE